MEEHVPSEKWLPTNQLKKDIQRLLTLLKKLIEKNQNNSPTFFTPTQQATTSHLFYIQAESLPDNPSSNQKLPLRPLSTKDIEEILKKINQNQHSFNEDEKKPSSLEERNFNSIFWFLSKNKSVEKKNQDIKEPSKKWSPTLSR